MSHFGKILCFALAVIALLVALSAFNRLPVPETGTLERMEQSWSGVLRVWVCEGWACGAGSLVPWLNAASAQFEKRHKGVYLHLSQVSAETLSSFNYAADYPPDLLIFAPGMLSSPDDLLPLPESQALRAELREYGGGYARPIALGGYVWARNRSFPADDTLFLLPEDTPWLCYSAALPALLNRKLSAEGEAAPPDSRYGIDLGLSSPAVAPEENHPIECTELIPSPDSARSANAYALFARGEAPMIAVTQREIRRLQLLDDSGRAPDWEIVAPAGAFTDQLALAAVVDIEKSDLEARQALCLQFIDFLLTEERQKALSSVRALRVTDGAPLYAGQRGMAQLEEAMLSNQLQTADPFDDRWRLAAREKASALLSRAESR